MFGKFNFHSALYIAALFSVFQHTLLASDMGQGSGLLGSRGLKAEASLQHFEQTPGTPGLPEFRATSAGLDLPLFSFLDASAAYTWGHGENRFLDADVRRLEGTLTAYVPLTSVRPFVSVTFGRSWEDIDYAGFGAFAQDYDYWRTGLGLEWRVSTKVSVQASVGYLDTLGNGPDNETILYSIRPAWWFTSRVCATAGVEFQGALGAALPDAWRYSTGLRVRF